MQTKTQPGKDYALHQEKRGREEGEKERTRKREERPGQRRRRQARPPRESVRID